MIYVFQYVILMIWLLAYIGFGALLSFTAIWIYRIIRNK